MCCLCGTLWIIALLELCRGIQRQRVLNLERWLEIESLGKNWRNLRSKVSLSVEYYNDKMYSPFMNDAIL